MKKQILKAAFIMTCCFFISIPDGIGQAKMTNGPELDNDRDNKMNRMIGGDDNSFYCYRVRSKGKGTSFYVEKYNKASLKREFSKEISLGEDEKKTTIEDVEYASGNIFVFRRRYDKESDKMTLFFQTISSSGKVLEDLKEVVSVSADHYEFVDFEIVPNPGKTKFLVKASHKASKSDTYKTDLILVDAVNVKKLNTRRVNENMHSGGGTFWTGLFGVDIDYGYIGLHLDDKDNIFYCLTLPVKEDKEKRRKLMLYTLNAGDNQPKSLELSFDDYYHVGDIEFSKANDGDVVVGGFLTDIVERRGRDLVKCGIFSFKVNVAKNALTGKATQFFDDKMLAALESKPKKAKYNNYKLDYILPIGDAIYYVGEQYRVTVVTQTSSNGMGGGRTTWRYEYMDVIVAKLTAKGEFEWVKNVPLRNEMSMAFPHVFKQYIAVATDKNLYVLCDDHPKNIARYQKEDFEPSDLKSVTGIHGSNFVCNTVSLKDGKVTDRLVLMENEDYCFAPIQERNPQFIPPSDCEIFVQSKDNEIYIYTEDRGRDRFARIKFQ